MRKLNASGCIANVTDKLIERLESEQDTSVSGIKSKDSFKQGFQKDTPLVRNCSHETNIDSKSSDRASDLTRSSPLGTKLRDLESQISQSFRDEELDTKMISEQLVLSVCDGSAKLGLRTRKVENNSMLHKVKDRNAGARSSLWWMCLPCVLAIGGSDLRGPKGLYSFKMSSHSNMSYTIAFEDHGEATNFCDLLESSFEDVGDFSADVVPLSTKELEQAMKSGAMNVFVVKKGQLKLYAGQPLEDVQMTLYSIVD